MEGRPLLNLSPAINYALGGLAVRWYHALNLAIHILAGLTLLGIVHRTLLQPGLRERFGAAETNWRWRWRCFGRFIRCKPSR